MLKEIVVAADAKAALRQRAMQLLATALSIEEIEQLDTAPSESVEAAIRSIQAARAVFEAALHELPEPRIRQLLEATLRHYPDGIDLALWRILAARGSPMGSVILRTAGPLAW